MRLFDLMHYVTILCVDKNRQSEVYLCFLSGQNTALRSGMRAALYCRLWGNQTLGYGQAILFFSYRTKNNNKIEQVLSTYQVLWRTLKKKFIQASLLTKKKIHNLTMRKNFMLQETAQTLYLTPTKNNVLSLISILMRLTICTHLLHIFVVSLKILFSPTHPQYSVYTKDNFSEYLEKRLH